MGVIGTAIGTLLPLIIFITGVWLVFHVLKKHAILALIVMIPLTVMLAASPLGKPIWHALAVAVAGLAHWVGH